MRAALIVASAFAVGGALAQSLPDSTSADRKSVAVTVYNQNLGLVREVRTLDVTRPGVSTLRFMDVPEKIDPRTVHLESLTAPDALAILEQNYEYDLISPQKLMEKFVGREVEIVEQAQDLTTRVSKATLLSTNGGPVFRVGDRIVLGQPGRVTLPEIPKDLVASPTLVWTVQAPKAGAQSVEASYLTDGLNWSADYVAVVDESDSHLGLTGWVTIQNQSGASFENATLKLVAGDVRRVQPERLYEADTRMRVAAAKAAPQFQEEGFFEYHLYTLERPTTVKNNQTKQISLLEATGVPVKKELLLVGSPWYYRNQAGTISQAEKVGVVLKFVNEKAGGLGVPLPKGTVRVYKKDRSGAQQFVGEDAIDHTPKDETVRLSVGDAFDVVADRVQTEWKALSPRESESAYKISIRNRKDEDVVVTVREPVGGDWSVVTSSIPGKKVDAGTLEFAVPVPKGKEVELTYRVRVRW